ncbi:MAG: outer membrane lipoprotein LolB [Proteobacteria bacterium]|nr:outer membrane lipoprotein LolB [Pseudomonadota bacterium]
MSMLLRWWIRFRFPAVAAVLLALAACAPVRPRVPATPPAQGQSARESQLAPRTTWNFDGHFAVSNGRDGGSGTVTWRADGANFSLLLRAPVTGKTIELQGGPGGAVLTGLHELPIRGDDAQALLADEFGWHMPVEQLTWWVRGLRAPGSTAQVQYGDDGLPSSLSQDGWTVQFRDWYDDSQPPLPRRIFAAKPPYSVRLLIEQWRIQ